MDPSAAAGADVTASSRPATSAMGARRWFMGFPDGGCPQATRSGCRRSCRGAAPGTNENGTAQTVPFPGTATGWGSIVPAVAAATIVAVIPVVAVVTVVTAVAVAAVMAIAVVAGVVVMPLDLALAVLVALHPGVAGAVAVVAVRHAVRRARTIGAIDLAVVGRAAVPVAHHDQAIVVAVVAMPVIGLAAAEDHIGDVDDDARDVLAALRLGRGRRHREDAETGSEDDRGEPAGKGRCDGHGQLLGSPAAAGTDRPCPGNREPVFNIWPTSPSRSAIVPEPTRARGPRQRRYRRRQFPGGGDSAHAGFVGRDLHPGLVRPGGVVRHVDAPTAKRQHRCDVRTQRVADHHEAVGRQVELLQQPRVGGRVLLADDLDAPEQAGQPAVADLRFLVEQVALG